VILRSRSDLLFVSSSALFRALLNNCHFDGYDTEVVASVGDVEAAANESGPYCVTIFAGTDETHDVSKAIEDARSSWPETKVTVVLRSSEPTVTLVGIDSEVRNISAKIADMSHLVATITGLINNEDVRRVPRLTRAQEKAIVEVAAGKSNAEIALEFGITVGAVEKMMIRALSRLGHKGPVQNRSSVILAQEYLQGKQLESKTRF
jgi:DNA-binding NarL/FixJ family response regulator